MSNPEQVQAIEANTNASRNNAMNQARLFSEMLAERRRAEKAQDTDDNKNNSSSTKLVTNNTSEQLTRDGNMYDTAMAGAGGVNAQIIATQSSQGSRGDSQQNFQGDRDANRIANHLMAAGAKGADPVSTAVQIRFADIAPEAPEIKQVLNGLQRLNVQISGPIEQGLRNMARSELIDLAKSLGQTTRAEIQQATDTGEVPSGVLLQLGDGSFKQVRLG